MYVQVSGIFIQFNKMFSDQLIDQLSMFIIRPHREIYGLDKLGPKKLIIKSAITGSYTEVYRQQATIVSEGRKIQLSIFEPYLKPGSNSSISSTPDMPEYLTKSVKISSQVYACDNVREVTLFLHTNSGSRLEGLQYCKYLLQYDHTVCLFDYSGSGVSEGQYVTMGLNEAKDLANVVRYLQQKFGIEKVSLWGRSMGAVTAVLYCAKYWRNVRKMVLDSPFCSFRQLVKEIVNSRTGLPEFLFGTILDQIEQNLKKKLSVNLMDIDLKQQIIRPGMQKIPIFFLISKDDKLVQPSHVQTLHQLHRGYKKILYLEGSHNKPRPSQIREQCAEFLCHKMGNTSSQKTIEGKKQYLTIISRKYSEEMSPHDKKTKLTSSSMILNMPETPSHPAIHQDYQLNLQTCHLANSNVEAPTTALTTPNMSIYKEALFLNLSKKSKLDSQQSSAQSTPRDDHSLNKYSGSKISLSQLKKSQADGDSTPLHSKNIPVMLNQNHHNHNNCNGNQYKGHADFKKQSRTMAIQYKNKIKEHINKI